MALDLSRKLASGIEKCHFGDHLSAIPDQDDSPTEYQYRVPTDIRLILPTKGILPVGSIRGIVGYGMKHPNTINAAVLHRYGLEKNRYPFDAMSFHFLFIFRRIFAPDQFPVLQMAFAVARLVTQFLLPNSPEDQGRHPPRARTTKVNDKCTDWLILQVRRLPQPSTKQRSFVLCLLLQNSHFCVICF